MDTKHLSPADIELDSSKKYQHTLLVYEYHIPLHTDQSLVDVMDIAKVAKQNGGMISICGKIATFKPEILLNKKSSIDYAISHDTEDAFIDMVTQRVKQWATIVALLLYNKDNTKDKQYR